MSPLSALLACAVVCLRYSLRGWLHFVDAAIFTRKKKCFTSCLFSCLSIPFEMGFCCNKRSPRPTSESN